MLLVPFFFIFVNAVTRYNKTIYSDYYQRWTVNCKRKIETEKWFRIRSGFTSGTPGHKPRMFLLFLSFGFKKLTWIWIHSLFFYQWLSTSSKQNDLCFYFIHCKGNFWIFPESSISRIVDLNFLIRLHLAVGISKENYQCHPQPNWPQMGTKVKLNWTMLLLH